MAPVRKRQGAGRGHRGNVLQQVTQGQEVPAGPAVLLPETSAAHIAKNAENTIEYLHRTVHVDGYWTPGADLATYLRLSLLNLYKLESDTANNIWTTALVLIYCMIHLFDYHADWMKLAEKARKWIFAQPYFEAAFIDIIKRACLLLGADPKAMLSSVFSRGGSKGATDLALLDERPLGNWVEMYLETAPYSKYYWNKVTNETRWDHPSDPIVNQLTPAERDTNFREQEMAKLKAERVAKALPMRFSINKKPYLAPKDEPCESCVDPTNLKQATIFCQACDVYYCSRCCDVQHMHPKYAGHCETSFRFVECIGRHGFPYLRHQKINNLSQN